MNSGETSITLSARAGDTSSIQDVAHAADTILSKPPEAVLEEPRARKSIWHELMSLVTLLRDRAATRKISILTGVLFGVLVLNVIGQHRMNDWQGAFFGAIEKRNLGEIGNQSLNFVAIVFVLLLLVIAQNWLVERIKIRVRAWLSGRLLDEWMAPARAYRLNMTSQERLNPDQRIQEDVRDLSEKTADLGVGFLHMGMILVTFIGVLWGMSSGISFDLFGITWAIPGYMVWFALLYAGVGALLAIRVGRPLISLNEERYTREANFRYSLVRVSDSAESIAFYRGEKDERGIVNASLARVLDTFKTLSFAHARLTWITVGHGWMVVILPVIVALPGYVQGKYDFGGLMIVVGAFNQVQGALRWFVEQYRTIAEWQACVRRVSVFAESITSVDIDDEKSSKIELVASGDGALIFEGVQVSLMDGSVVIKDATARIEQGERVLLVGPSGSGKSTLFRAIAGLWPWGAGRIDTPSIDDMMFLPQKPYMPLGTLASALSYPHADGQWSDGELIAALKRVNLEKFSELLHRQERWDKLLSLGQQQRLAFARLVLHQPKWVFLDEATSALDDENQDLVMSLFAEELKSSGVLSIAHRRGLAAYHTRKLHLDLSPSGCVLRMRKKKANPVIDPRKKKKSIVKRLLPSLRRKAATL